MTTPTQLAVAAEALHVQLQKRADRKAWKPYARRDKAARRAQLFMLDQTPVESRRPGPFLGKATWAADSDPK